jgi:hypothetical protein
MKVADYNTGPSRPDPVRGAREAVERIHALADEIEPLDPVAASLLREHSLKGCEQCGREFHVLGSRRAPNAKRGDARGCSDGCRAAWHYQNRGRD